MNLLSKEAYYYDLPEELIAQTPVQPRDSSRLLVFDRKTEEIEHKIFRDLTQFLKPGDVLVINNTKVLPARLFGYKDTGAKIETLLQRRINLTTWKVIAKPTKRLSEGMVITYNQELSARVLEIKEYGECTFEFIFSGRFEEILDRVGTTPLPPYIKEKLKDSSRYQTVYAVEAGSSAAPTAGLHFTPELMQKLQDMGVMFAEVLLHVGLGTFRPVKESDILKHKMHSEFYSVSQSAAEIINNAKAKGGRIIAVGTTSVRVLESATQNGKIQPQSGDTEIFIYPSYNFKMVDGLITNFHLPESTLIMLVSALIGYQNTMEVYKAAAREKYRFFSFGDACLFL